MKNISMVIVCLVTLFICVLSLADDKQVAAPVATAGELAKQKATFNRDQAVYNDKANKDIRAKKLASKKLISREVNLKKVQDKLDEKNGIVQKDGLDEKNKQYDKQLTVKF